MRATLESMEAEKGALVQFGVCVASRVDANEALARLPSGTYTTSVTCEMVVVMISFVPDSRRYFLMKAENKCQVNVISWDLISSSATSLCCAFAASNPLKAHAVPSRPVLGYIARDLQEQLVTTLLARV
jgi:hypothetical protein